MQITGIGSRYNNYIYNIKTNRLSTKDGNRDEFPTPSNRLQSGDMKSGCPSP